MFASGMTGAQVDPPLETPACLRTLSATLFYVSRVPHTTALLSCMARKAPQETMLGAHACTAQTPTTPTAVWTHAMGVGYTNTVSCLFHQDKLLPPCEQNGRYFQGKQ